MNNKTVATKEELEDFSDKQIDSMALQENLMRNAYCAYKQCSNTTTYPLAKIGAKCFICNKPLSWGGFKKKPNKKYYIKNENGQFKIDKEGNKVFEINKDLFREPFGKRHLGKKEK